jgi:hypothetical protein
MYLNALLSVSFEPLYAGKLECLEAGMLLSSFRCQLPLNPWMLGYYINPAGKFSTVVIPAKAGIQKDTGCRIKSGMTGFSYLVAGLIIRVGG